MEKNLKRERKKDFEGTFNIKKNMVEAGKYNLVFLKLTGHTLDEMREISDKIKSGLKMGVVFISSVDNNKIAYVLSAADDAVKSGIDSGRLLKKALEGCDARGGGRPHLGQGGGTGAENIEKAFNRLKAILEME